MLILFFFLLSCLVVVDIMPPAVENRLSRRSLLFCQHNFTFFFSYFIYYIDSASLKMSSSLRGFICSLNNARLSSGLPERVDKFSEELFFYSQHADTDLVHIAYCMAWLLDGMDHGSRLYAGVGCYCLQSGRMAASNRFAVTSSSGTAYQYVCHVYMS